MFAKLDSRPEMDQLLIRSLIVKGEVSFAAGALFLLLINSLLVPLISVLTFYGNIAILVSHCQLLFPNQDCF